MSGPTSRPPTGVPGRRARVEPGPESRRTAVLGLVVVALTVAVLALAGTSPRGIGARVQEFERVELEQRTFACPGGIAEARSVHGSVESGAVSTAPIGERGAVFEDEQAVALGAFAAQESRTAGWLAWGPCPEPRARWWFVGAGAAAVTHDTVLTMVNPRPGQAVVDVDVYGRNGPVEAPGLHGLTVPAGGTREIDLASLAPAVGEVAVSVVATRGLVAVSAADRFAPGVVGKPVEEWLPAQSVPGTDLTIAGLPARPDKASLVVVNPRPVEAIVSVEVVGAGGTFAPDDVPTLTVAPGSTAVLPLRAVFDGKPLAVRLRSTRPVTAAVRTVIGTDVAYGTGVRALRQSTAFAVPAGDGDARLTLSSTGRASSVEVTAFDGRGREVLGRRIEVEAATSVGIGLPASTRYVRLVAASPDVVAGFSVRDDAGIAGAGVTPSIRSVLLPVVRPGW